MDDNIAIIVSRYLDSASVFHYLNYYYQQQLSDTGDEEYVYKLECLYEWWEQAEREHAPLEADELLEWGILMRMRDERESLFDIYSIDCLR